MKIKLEFEDADLRKMITEYFEKNGFRVKNLDELCEKFKVSFPEGLKVAAETVVVAPPPREEVEFDLPEKPEQLEPVKGGFVESGTGNGTRTMSVTDLMDPTYDGGVPSRDELLAEEKREMERILRKSKEIEEN